MKRATGGFSLLEVIVAMAIMAMSLGVLYHAGGGALRGIIETGARTRATASALALLDMHWSVPPGGVRESGNVGDMEWTLATTLFRAEQDKNWALHQIEVTVTWEAGRRSLRLASLLPERRAPLESKR